MNELSFKGSQLDRRPNFDPRPRHGALTDTGFTVAKRIDVLIRLMFTLLDHNRSREKTYRARFTGTSIKLSHSLILVRLQGSPQEKSLPSTHLFEDILRELLEKLRVHPAPGVHNLDRIGGRGGLQNEKNCESIFVCVHHPSSIPKWAPAGPDRGPTGAQPGPNLAQPGPNRGPYGMLLGHHLVTGKTFSCPPTPLNLFCPPPPPPPSALCSL